MCECVCLCACVSVCVLTEHHLQTHEAPHKVVKVDGEVLFSVAQDDQLEQVIGQLEA